MCYHPQLHAWKSPNPQKARPSAAVLSLAPAAAPPADGLMIGGLVVEIRQGHLLEPFGDLLAAIEQLADAAGTRNSADPPGTESAAVRALYLALGAFYRALLPCAPADTLDQLTYSVALLLIGEAVEAARIVQPAIVSDFSPSTSQAALSPVSERTL